MKLYGWGRSETDALKDCITGLHSKTPFCPYRDDMEARLKTLKSVDSEYGDMRVYVIIIR